MNLIFLIPLNSDNFFLFLQIIHAILKFLFNLIFFITILAQFPQPTRAKLNCILVVFKSPVIELLQTNLKVYFW